MDFGLSEEATRLVERAADHARRQRAGQDAPSAEKWAAWGAAGWLGTCVPTDVGGEGHGAVSTLLAFETLGREGIDRGWLFAVGAHLFGCSMALANHGSPLQKSAWCERLARGRAVGALAFTEPEGGSNLASCATLAERSANRFRLSGCKTYVTNGASAELFLVLARTGSKPSPFAYSIFAVPRDTPGLSVQKIEGYSGLAQSMPATVSFDGCMLPQSALLGREGAGMPLLLDIMRWERTCILAGSLGALERDLARVTGYLGRRGDSAQPATQFQAVGHALARIRAEMESARWLMRRAAWELDRQGGSLLYPAMSKLTVSETLVECTLRLRQLAAGHGWAGGLGLVEALDDALATLSASGTSEVQLGLIATQMGPAT